MSFQEEKAPNQVAMEGAMADGVVLVTSATGNIGRYVIKSILQSSSGLKVRATVHDPAKAEFFKQVRNLKRLSKPYFLHHSSLEMFIKRIDYR